MEAVNQQGIYLDNHITQIEKFNLYAIDMFFVEVCYNSIKNKILLLNNELLTKNL